MPTFSGPPSTRQRTESTPETESLPSSSTEYEVVRQPVEATVGVRLLGAVESRRIVREAQAL